MNFQALDFDANPLLAIGILSVAGLLGGFAARKFKFPTISGYIIIGIILSLANIIPKDLIDNKLDIITDLSLGIIGYLVGGTLYIGKLKKLGKDILIITPFEALGAWAFVAILVTTLGPYIINFGISADSNTSFIFKYLPIAIVMGAISCATAPAASFAVVREYGATGPFTTILLAIIVLDDAIAVIAYSLGSNISKSLILKSTNINWYEATLAPFIDIFGSMFLGAVLGFCLILAGKFIKKKPQLMTAILGSIFVCAGLSEALNLSNILASMVMGFIVVNMLKQNENMFNVVHEVEEIIFAMFFTLAGAHFDYTIIKTAGILALVLVVGRTIGKFAGVSVGATISGSSPSVKKYLGFGLFPIAGVTIGLSMLLKRYPAFAGIENIMINGILASVIINELIAPFLIKFALFKTGEASRAD
ncbi:MAG: cation:proton antiporter [Actinobacteria bacterium]|nr:cation:proton antiporter [Actinomycetota bacterium]